MKELTDLREYKTVSTAKEYEDELYRIRGWYTPDEEHLYLRNGFWERHFLSSGETIVVLRKNSQMPQDFVPCP